MNYLTKTPILIIGFNRPDNVKKVLEAVKLANPQKLYLVVDGPRDGEPDESTRCNSVKKFFDSIDWCDNIYKKYRVRNVGCKKNVSEAITWVFENEERLIVLEDDLVPSKSFFRFCDEMLEYYKDNDNVGLISGYNVLQEYNDIDNSYYFSNLSIISGWATWKRAWINYDPEMKKMCEKNIKSKILKSFKKNRHGRYQYNRYLNTYKGIKKGISDSWAYPWSFSVISNNCCSIVPTKNLVKNIGFDEEAHNGGRASSPFAKPYAEEISFPLIHPKTTHIDKEADAQTLEIQYRNGYPFWYAYLGQFYRKFILKGDLKVVKIIKRLFKKIKIIK